MEAGLKLKLDRIADQVVRNAEEINNILSNCSVESNLLSTEFQNKIEDIFNSNTSNILNQQTTDEYYDLETIDTILKHLDSGKPAQQTNRISLIRSESQRSIYSSSSSLHMTTIESTANNQENIKEFMRQLSEAKEIIESITNCSLQIPETTTITTRVTEQKNQFIELVFSLKRLLKELKSIASTDKKENEAILPDEINEDLLSGLQHLNEVNIF